MAKAVNVWGFPSVSLSLTLSLVDDDAASIFLNKTSLGKADVDCAAGVRFRDPTRTFEASNTFGASGSLVTGGGGGCAAAAGPSASSVVGTGDGETAELDPVLFLKNGLSWRSSSDTSDWYLAEDSGDRCVHGEGSSTRDLKRLLDGFVTQFGKWHVSATPTGISPKAPSRRPGSYWAGAVSINTVCSSGQAAGERGRVHDWHVV